VNEKVCVIFLRHQYIYSGVLYILTQETKKYFTTAANKSKQFTG